MTSSVEGEWGQECATPPHISTMYRFVWPGCSGTLLIAEVASRFEAPQKFVRQVQAIGFQLIKQVMMLRHYTPLYGDALIL